MAISEVSGSPNISIAQRPHVNLPSVSGDSMTFTCRALTANGRCSLSGATGDNPAGFTLGWIQMQWIETNWGYYRGQTNADGSSFLQRARPPARAAQGCRDTLTVGAVLVDNNPGRDRSVASAGATFPLVMTAFMEDPPEETYDLSRVNSFTRKENFLHEAQVELHFCTVLTLQKPDGTYQPLRHFLWNVHWQATFRPSNYNNLAAAWTITPKAALRTRRT